MSHIRRSFVKRALLAGLILIPPFRSFASSNLKSLLKNKNGEPDWDSVRKLFLIKSEKKYFNTASLGPSPSPIIDKMFERMQNYASTAELGYHHVKGIRQKVADFINSDLDSVAFIRNATEGINIVSHGLDLKEGDEIILTSHEHIGCTAPWFDIRERIGIELKIVVLDLSAKNNFEKISQAITDKTKVMCISHITCTTGMILPVKELTALCKEKGIISCIDGAQALGMIQLDMEDLNPDFYVASGHKWLFGPKESGILYANPNSLHLLKYGYAGAYYYSDFELNKESASKITKAKRFEYGTRSTSKIEGIGAAIDFLNEIGMQHVESRSRELANYLRSKLNKIDDVSIITPETAEYNTPILSFNILKGDYLELQKQIRTKYQIRVRAIYENNLNAIRISCTIFNSEKEIDILISSIEEYLDTV